jgi:hypothetical protein
MCSWVAGLRIELYASDHARALERSLQADELVLAAAVCSPLWHGCLLLGRAAAALCASLGTADPSPMLGRAEADVRAVAALELGCFADALGLLTAGIANRRGDLVSAIAALDAVLASPAAQAQPLVLASALRRRAELGQARVAGLVQHADAMMRERGVLDPSRMVSVFAPGFERRVSIAPPANTGNFK